MELNGEEVREVTENKAILNLANAIVSAISRVYLLLLGLAGDAPSSVLGIFASGRSGLSRSISFSAKSKGAFNLCRSPLLLVESIKSRQLGSDSSVILLPMTTRVDFARVSPTFILLSSLRNPMDLGAPGAPGSPLTVVHRMTSFSRPW